MTLTCFSSDCRELVGVRTKYTSDGGSEDLIVATRVPTAPWPFIVGNLASGKAVTRTWFIGLDITGSGVRERLILFFNGASWNLRKHGPASSVSLAVSRFDGTRFVRLSLEPIALREVGYSKGTLIFVSRDGTAHEGDVRRNLRAFVANIITTCL
jgi:hypothetical protein